MSFTIRAVLTTLSPLGLLTFSFVASTTSSNIFFTVRAEGELKVRDEGQLIASRHFPVHGFIPLESVIPPLESAVER